MTTPADELRAAADKLRTLATDATPGPWRTHDTHLGRHGYTATVLSDKGNDTDLRAWLPSLSQEPWDQSRNVWADACYIAAMHPGVGAPLADWLDAEASGPLADLHSDRSAERGCTITAALAVARQILAA